MRRTLRKLICVVCLLTLLALTVYAHPGKTDEYGGHYDRSTGEYHWHHGYEAHQHEDLDGDGFYEYCPYDFDDNVTHETNSAGSSGSDSSTNPTVETLDTRPVSNTFSQETEAVDSSAAASAKSTQTGKLSAAASMGVAEQEVNISLSAFVVLQVVIFVFYFVIYKKFRRKWGDEVSYMQKQLTAVQENKKKREDSLCADLRYANGQIVREFKQIESLKKELESERTSRQSLISENEKLKAMWGAADKQNAALAEILRRALPSPFQDIVSDDTIPTIAVPKQVSFTDAGLPVWGKETFEKPYGEYTVFTTAESTLFHSNPHCSNNHGHMSHYFHVARHRRPCMKCCAAFPWNFIEPEWWKDIRTIYIYNRVDHAHHADFGGMKFSLEMPHPLLIDDDLSETDDTPDAQ